MAEGNSAIGLDTSPHPIHRAQAESQLRAGRGKEKDLPSGSLLCACTPALRARGIRERWAPRGTHLKSEKQKSKDLDVVEKGDKEERADRGQGKGQ